jgi:hypothetical protein
MNEDVGKPGAAGANADIAEAHGHRLWGGRFATGPAPALEELNRSLGVDRRLWSEDIEASRAWVCALERAGVLERDEAATIDAGLLRVHHRLADGDAADADDEDIHTLVERLLYEEIGDVAGKLHTGRSRNDQVATDTRLWAMRAALALDRSLVELQRALVDQAGASIDLLMPSYTHLRRAQPIRVAHWLLAHFWAFQRDRQRLSSALDRVAVLPLGSGAISGSGFPVDRTLIKELLGFRSVSPNSRRGPAHRRPDRRQAQQPAPLRRARRVLAPDRVHRRAGQGAVLPRGSLADGLQRVRHRLRHVSRPEAGILHAARGPPHARHRQAQRGPGGDDLRRA